MECSDGAGDKAGRGPPGIRFRERFGQKGQPLEVPARRPKKRPKPWRVVAVSESARETLWNFSRGIRAVLREPGVANAQLQGKGV